MVRGRLSDGLRHRLMDEGREEMNHLILRRGSLLLTVLTLAAALAVGCQGFAAVGPAEQAPMASTPTPEPSWTPVPSAQPTVTSSPTPTPVPPTATVTSSASRRPSGPFEGARAPDLTLPDLAGQEVSLSGLKGKAVLLNFWATW